MKQLKIKDPCDTVFFFFGMIHQFHGNSMVEVWPQICAIWVFDGGSKFWIQVLFQEHVRLRSNLEGLQYTAKRSFGDRLEIVCKFSRSTTRLKYQ